MSENEEIKNEVVQENPTPKKKKFDKNSVLWCVMILVIIGVVAGALLGGINVVTYVDPDEAILTIINNNYDGAADITKDSSYVVNAFLENWIEGWQKNNWKNSKKEEVKNKDLWLELIELTKTHKVTFNKVKGHSDNELNNRCDFLATSAIDKIKK